MDPTAAPGGRRAKQLQVAVEGVRRSRPSVRHRDGDAELLALIEGPFEDVEEAHERLTGLRDAFEARADRRATFLSIYARMTGAVAERIDEGGFADPAWVSDYLVAFANLYREAVRDYEADELGALADPWQLAFDAAERGDAMVLQDAALGVNAHINYDLALALERIGVGPDRESKYEDHSAVTDVIREILDDAQDALAERDAPGLATIDESMGRVDEWLWVFTIDECRDSAWRTAVAMHSRFGHRRRFARWVNDVTSTGVAHLILASQASDRVHETLLSLEGSAADDG